MDHSELGKESVLDIKAAEVKALLQPNSNNTVHLTTPVVRGGEVAPWQDNWTAMPSNGNMDTDRSTVFLMSDDGLANSQDVVYAAELIKYFLREEFAFQLGITTNMQVLVRQRWTGYEGEEVPHGFNIDLIVSGDHHSDHEQELGRQFAQFADRLRQDPDYQSASGSDFAKLVAVTEKKLGGNRHAQLDHLDSSVQKPVGDQSEKLIRFGDELEAESTQQTTSRITEYIEELADEMGIEISKGGGVWIEAYKGNLVVEQQTAESRSTCQLAVLQMLLSHVGLLDAQKVGQDINLTRQKSEIIRNLMDQYPDLLSRNQGGVLNFMKTEQINQWIDSLSEALINENKGVLNGEVLAMRQGDISAQLSPSAHEILPEGTSYAVGAFMTVHILESFLNKKANVYGVNWTSGSDAERTAGHMVMINGVFLEKTEEQQVVPKFHVVDPLGSSGWWSLEQALDRISGGFIASSRDRAHFQKVSSPEDMVS